MTYWNIYELRTKETGSTTTGYSDIPWTQTQMLLDEIFPTVGRCSYRTSVQLAPLRKPPATKTERSATDETAFTLETKTNSQFNNNCRYYWTRWHMSPVILSYCPVLNLDAMNLNNARKHWLTRLCDDAHYYYYYYYNAFPFHSIVQARNLFNRYTENKLTSLWEMRPEVALCVGKGAPQRLTGSG